MHCASIVDTSRASIGGACMQMQLTGRHRRKRARQQNPCMGQLGTAALCRTCPAPLPAPARPGRGASHRARLHARPAVLEAACARDCEGGLEAIDIVTRPTRLHACRRGPGKNDRDACLAPRSINPSRRMGAVRGHRPVASAEWNRTIVFVSARSI